MSSQIFYELGILPDDAAILNSDKLERYRKYRCPECGAFKGFPEREILELEYVPKKLVLGFVRETGLGLMNIEILQKLKLELGSAFDGKISTGPILVNGHEFTSVLWFYVKEQIVVRGSERATVWACPACKVVYYQGYGQRFLMTRNEPYAIISGGSEGDLILSDKVALNIGILDLVPSEQVVVLDEPIDGFPKNLTAEYIEDL